MKNPAISVLLPCYNSAETLRASIASVIAQSFADFELLILDDGSEESVEIIDDPRIIYLRSEKNLGLSAQLNIGIERARGEFIARLDADDIAQPYRLQKQIDAMGNNPEVGICGSWAQLFDENGAREIWHYSSLPDECHATLFLRSSFLHPGVMIRTSVLVENHIRYDETLKVAQDYELWYRLLKVTTGINLEECLTHYRISSSQLTRAHSDTKDRETRLIRERILGELGIDDLDCYEQILASEWEETMAFYTRVAAWLNTAAVANRQRNVFPEAAFETLLARMFFDRCQCATRRGFDGLRAYREISFGNRYRARPSDLIRLRMKSALKPALSS
jgi:hypothetical protein